LKDLSQKFEVIKNKKVSEVEETLNKKCENEKSTLEESLKSSFEVEKNQISTDVDSQCQK